MRRAVAEMCAPAGFLENDGSMPRVLVTGSSGQVGGAVARLLEIAGWSVVRFDLADGDDLRVPAQVSAAAAGCDAIVHAGALAHDTAGTPEEIMATNVLGTWHVLSAAEQHAVRRVVYFSSGQVFGCAEGESTPDYLPIDDDHPLRAARPYGMSKRLAEEMCEIWTARTGATTVVLRPAMILDDVAVARIFRDDVEYGAFVHLDDVAAATHRALVTDVDAHVRMLLCGPGAFDSTPAQQTLGWSPEHDWPE